MDGWRFVSGCSGICGFQRLIIHNSKRERWQFVNRYSCATVVLILHYFMLKWNLILLFFAKKTQWISGFRAFQSLLSLRSIKLFKFWGGISFFQHEVFVTAWFASTHRIFKSVSKFKWKLAKLVKSVFFLFNSWCDCTSDASANMWISLCLVSVSVLHFLVVYSCWKTHKCKWLVYLQGDFE